MKISFYTKDGIEFFRAEKSHLTVIERPVTIEDIKKYSLQYTRFKERGRMPRKSKSRAAQKSIKRIISQKKEIQK